jgi:hypothetical protein
VLKPSTEAQADAVRPQFLTRGLPRVPALYLLLLAVAICYLMPTVVEWAILRYSRAWGGAVLVGDLCGCIGIFVLLKRRRMAVVLYVSLTIAEWWLCAAQLVSTQVLLFVMDAVPTAILAGAILRPQRLAFAKR